ncbi:MAG: UDP-N-acetylmuramoyl-L-alanyl-D-glutamate--2,6-diaminopimelate ligase [Candidatus Riflemargulisbacteria bacterium]
MIQYDTRKINTNDVFLAIDKGQNHITRELIEKTNKIIKVEKKFVFKYLTNLWQLNTHKVQVIGITGTNGKTTVTYLINEVLKISGAKPRVIGTINSPLTTPEMFDLLSIIKDMTEKHETHLIMEVSSIGIVEERIYGLPFKVKLLTNITQDHLDYHKTFKNYVESKFVFLKNPIGKTIYPSDYKKIKLDFSHKLIGKFNENNLKAAYSACQALGISEAIIKQSLATALPPKGRFEKVNIQKPYTVVVDYAHTPDGLANVLKEARKITKNKLITVFGAGGDRDNKKRPIMGKIAENWSDIIIVTSDNPRTEDPQSIIDQISDGITDKTKLIVQIDRKEAIKKALELAKENDFIMIAGKGHEDYQIIGTTKTHFDDSEIVKELSICTQ